MNQQNFIMQWMHGRFKLAKLMVALLATGTVWLIITVKFDKNKVTLFNQDSESCTPKIDLLEEWRNSLVTREDLKLYTDLGTGYHKIKINIPLTNPNISDKSNTSGRILQNGGFAVLNKSQKINKCLFINQTEKGLGKLINAQNFNGVHCAKMKASFNRNKADYTALASFPGSGNTWVRHLMEYISGIHTGSVYNDQKLKVEFSGEGHVQGVIAIKTHRTNKLNYANSVLLIRNPRDAILSWYNYRNTKSHTGKTEEARFNTTGWRSFVDSRTNAWEKFHRSWLNDYKGRMIVLSYSRLQHDFINELYRLGVFLDISMSYKTLWCAFQRQEGSFHRKSHIDRNKVFTKDMLDQIAKTRDKVEAVVSRMIGDDALGLF